MLSLSVVMPAYNESASITDAISETVEHVLSVVPESELIVVDDGSTDDTANLIAALEPKIPNLKLIRQANGGHGSALMHGLAESRGETLLLLDSDRQISLLQFAEHWKFYTEQQCVAVLGVRKPRHDPFHRLLVTRAMKFLIFCIFRKAPQDAGVPYKIVSREKWLEAAQYISAKSWIPSVLLAIFLLHHDRNRVFEIPVLHAARSHGQSSLNFNRLTKFCMAAATEVIAFRKIAKSKK